MFFRHQNGHGNGKKCGSLATDDPSSILRFQTQSAVELSLTESNCRLKRHFGSPNTFFPSWRVCCCSIVPRDRAGLAPTPSLLQPELPRHPATPPSTQPSMTISLGWRGRSTDKIIVTAGHLLLGWPKLRAPNHPTAECRAGEDKQQCMHPNNAWMGCITIPRSSDGLRTPHLTMSSSTALRFVPRAHAAPHETCAIDTSPYPSQTSDATISLPLPDLLVGTPGG